LPKPPVLLREKPFKLEDLHRPTQFLSLRKTPGINQVVKPQIP